MDVIYHRNCLDGVYSTYLLYLFSRFATQEYLDQLVTIITKLDNHDLTQYYPQQPLIKLPQQKIDVQFFQRKGDLSFNSFGIFAGQFHHYYIQNKILFVLDNNCQSTQNLKKLSQKYYLIIIIDHHYSFLKNKQELGQQNIKNIYYIYNDLYCATFLTFNFLNLMFGFQLCLPTDFGKQLSTIVNYVGKNDLKKDQDKQSKCFVLGFYFFGIQLSHMNPWLFKRLGNLQLDYVLSKGNNLYQPHFKKIQEEIKEASLAQLNKSKKYFLMTTPSDPTIISDIGTVLSYLSCQMGGVNLAILLMPRGDGVRLCCRSHRKFPQPLALDISLQYGGGGHKEAAGFKLTKSQFKNFAHLKGKPKISLNLSIEQIENIIFNRQLIK